MVSTLSFMYHNPKKSNPNHVMIFAVLWIRCHALVIIIARPDSQITGNT